MPQFVILSNLTAKGLAEIKNAPARYEAVVKGVEAAGGRVLSFHATTGAYDYVMVAEAVSEEAAALMSLATAAQGYVTTQTLRGFTPEEFAGLVSKLP
jgi:uncharacterized protein with GYD domain